MPVSSTLAAAMKFSPIESGAIAFMRLKSIPDKAVEACSLRLHFSGIFQQPGALPPAVARADIFWLALLSRDLVMRCLTAGRRGAASPCRQDDYDSCALVRLCADTLSYSWKPSRYSRRQTIKPRFHHRIDSSISSARYMPRIDTPPICQ